MLEVKLEFKKEWEIVGVKRKDEHCSEYVLNCCAHILQDKVIEHRFKNKLEDTERNMEEEEGLILFQAPTGSGKTFRLLERAIRYAKRGRISLILARLSRTVGS